MTSWNNVEIKIFVPNMKKNHKWCFKELNNISFLNPIVLLFQIYFAAFNHVHRSNNDGFEVDIWYLWLTQDF